MIKEIEGIGKPNSEISNFTGQSNHLLRFLQYLWMNHYINDETDFLVKIAIIRKSIEVHKEIKQLDSQDLVEALIGRLEALYPEKQDKINLQFYELNRVKNLIAKSG